MRKLDSTYGAIRRALDQTLDRASNSRVVLDALRAAPAIVGPPVRDPALGAVVAATTSQRIRGDAARALAAQANQAGRRAATLLG